MNKPYDTAAILRQNVADLERELQRQRERADKAEAKLKELREQEPVAYVKYKATGGNVGLSWMAIPTGVFYPCEGERLYTRPIPAPAPAVPATAALAIFDDLRDALLSAHAKAHDAVYRAMLQSAGGGE